MALDIVIMAAGKGTRMKSSQPKVLHRLAGKSLLAHVLATTATLGEHRILVCPDHPTFITTKTHSRGHVPFVMAGTDIPASGQTTYDEIAAAASGRRIEPGWQLMGDFLKKGVSHQI